MTNYPGLGDMFYEGANVFKTHEGFRRSEEAAAAHQQGLAEALARQQRDAEMHPLKMEYENQRARKQRLESDLAEREHPYKLKKVEYDAQEAEYKDMDRFGQALEQWGSIAEANQGQIPLELQARMPKELAAIFTQPDGWKQAKAAGAAMRQNSQKWLSQQSKQGSAEDIAALKARQAAEAAAERARQAELDRASRERLAAQRLENARRLATDKRSASQDRGTLENYARDLAKARDELLVDNPTAAAAMEARYQKVISEIKAIRSAPASVPDDFKRELLKLKPTGTPPPAQEAPAATAPASQDNDPLGIRKKQ
jgi:hypothetical protein